MTVRHAVAARPTPDTDLDFLESVHREKLSVLGQMASSMAHELSNPLAAIVASVQTILAFGEFDNGFGPARPPPGTTPKFRDDLELILSEARRAGEIVSNLLAFARQDPHAPEPVSVTDIVERAVVLSRHHLTAHNVQLLVADPHGLRDRGDLYVNGDPNQLQQVLVNLLVNAQQALHERRDGVVTIGMFVREALVEIDVVDNGPGVPMDIRETIFEPFFTTKARGKGTGLGLSISAGIVRSHGGELRLTTEGDGARFVLALPLLVGYAPTATPDGSDTPGLVRGERARNGADQGTLLLVDDERSIQRSVGRFLRTLGYRVQAASTGDEALIALQAQQFDAMICDIRMPGMSGEQLFDFVQERHPAMTGRIVFTSGDFMREETRAFVQRSGCPWLRKPYDLTDLVNVLSDLCHPAS